MNNPYNHTGYVDQGEVAREKAQGQDYWKRELLYAEQRSVREAMRKRAMKRLAEIGIAAVVLGGSLFWLIHYFYTRYLWTIWQ